MNIKIIENFLDPEYLSTLQSLDIKPAEQNQINIPKYYNRRSHYTE